MSAQNGDKSRFNRERIARRKRTHELLECTKALKSGDATVRAQPRSVSA